jgi:hypothetical protein
MLAAVRWLPPVAALGYALVLVRRINDVVSQLTWNADYVSVMVIAQSIGTEGKAGRAIVVQAGYYWFDLLTLRLPYHRQLWEYAPYAMALVTLGLLAWVAGRLAGRYAALLAAALGLGASPLVLSTQAAQSYHGSTWFGAALLAAYVCWLLSRRASLRATLAVSAAVAAAAGFATASDPLLVPTGDVPLVAAILLAWRARSADFPRRTVLTGLGTAAAVAAVAGGIALAARIGGYTSSFPRGLTHFVTRDHLAGNLGQLASGVFEVAGMPHQGSVLGLLLGLLLAAGVMLPVLWLILSIRTSMPSPMLAVLAFWSASAVFLAAAFVLSDIPSDFLQNSSRYLVPLFYAAVATVPLWVGADPVRAAAIAGPAAFFILANAAAVEHDASAGVFEPRFNSDLGPAIAFLEQQGLTRGYAAYDEASSISFKTDFALQVYPITDQLLTADETCGPPGTPMVCPYTYESVSDWYTGHAGPTFILFDPEMNRLSQPPPASLEPAASVYRVGRFVIYVYDDDVATHMALPRKFTRPLF